MTVALSSDIAVDGSSSSSSSSRSSGADRNDVWRVFPEVHLKIQTTHLAAPDGALEQQQKQMRNLVLMRSFCFVSDATVHRRIIRKVLLPEVALIGTRKY